MNASQLRRPLQIAADLDKYLDWHRARKGGRPDHIYVTAAQRESLIRYACDGARVDNWRDVPLIVLGDA